MDEVGYTGHKHDTDFGLSYMQSRYYDLVVGRFYSNCPVGVEGHLKNGSSQGFNRYAYAYNNPSLDDLTVQVYPHDSSGMIRTLSMKKIMIQFHATLEELVEYINSVSSEFGLFVTVMVLRPFALKELDGELSVEELNVDGDIRITLTAQKPSMDAFSPNNFYDLNQGTIGLHIGRLTEQELKESVLAFMSDDKEKAAIANKVASRLKKLTKAGAIAVNPVNGAEASARSHRYTEGAKAMYDDGVKILPLAGNSFFKLAD